MASNPMDLEANVSNISYELPSSVNIITFVSGGYFVVGKILIMNARITTTSSVAKIADVLAQFPSPILSTSDSVLVGCQNRDYSLFIDKEGRLKSNYDIPNGETLIISTIYAIA